MKLIWFLVKSSWVGVVVAAIAGSISGICSAAAIAVMTHAIRTSANESLLLGFFSIAITAVITNFISQFVLAELSYGAIYRMRMRLSQRILSCPLQQLEELGANRILATLNEDTNTIGASITNLPFICMNVAIVVGGLIYLLWLSWQSFLVTIVVLSIAISIIQVLLNQAHQSFRRAREEQDHLFKHFRTITDGIKELKLHAQRRRAFLDEELQTTANSVRQHNTRSMKIVAIVTSIGDLLKFLVLGTVVFIIPQLVPIDAAVLTSYVLILVFMTEPLSSLLQMIPSFDRANVALDKIEALGLSLANQSEHTTNAVEPQAFDRIDLIQVAHTYQMGKGEPFTLGAIDLSIRAGELLFIIGGNGSGKSTLAKVMTGLYIPESGELRLDNQLITDHNRESYRQLFSTVFSDFYLFDRALGLASEQLDAEARKYLQQLQLDHKVQVEDGRLSTIALSQGQRKRLALLTAYLEDRPIYLFDEWAADQDPFFREVFYQQILPELKRRGKTVLVITHDDRYFQVADRLIKLDYGQLV